MNSIAIWYEKNPQYKGVEIANLDLHINHWKLKLKSQYSFSQLRKKKYFIDSSDYFIDFGIKISTGENIVSRVCIYVPNSFSKKEELIEDIGAKLQSKQMLTAVFNEAYNFATTAEQKIFSVTDENVPIFNIYMLDVMNDVYIENAYNGTIIKFNFRVLNNLPTYYRFRLKAAFAKNLNYIFTPSNSFLESAYSSIEVIDFRINDTRNLDVSLIENINNNHCRFKLSLVHYFVIRNVKDEFILSNQELNSVRQLEDNIWTSYINQREHKYEKSFAYHLKKKVSTEDANANKYIEEFSAVLKFRFEDGKLIKYFFYFIIFAIFSGILGNSFYDILKPYLKELYHLVCDPIHKFLFSRSS